MSTYDWQRLVGSAAFMVCGLCMVVAILSGDILMAAWCGGWFGIAKTQWHRIMAR